MRHVYHTLNCIPQSVIDVGCGKGQWLAACRKLGTSKVLGIDYHIDPSTIEIHPNEYVSHDLEDLKNLHIHERFEAAICLETAEHISPSHAPDLIALLTARSPIVIFSAAVPAQADLGIGHVNEQWPSYWQHMFAQHNFVLTDALRPHILSDETIKWYYRQNIFIAFSRQLYEESYRHLPLFSSDFLIIYKDVFAKYMKKQ